MVYWIGLLHKDIATELDGTRFTGYHWRGMEGNSVDRNRMGIGRNGLKHRSGADDQALRPYVVRSVGHWSSRLSIMRSEYQLFGEARNKEVFRHLWRDNDC